MWCRGQEREGLCLTYLLAMQQLGSWEPSTWPPGTVWDHHWEVIHTHSSRTHTPHTNFLLIIFLEKQIKAPVWLQKPSGALCGGSALFFFFTVPWFLHKYWSKLATKISLSGSGHDTGCDSCQEAVTNYWPFRVPKYLLFLLFWNCKRWKLIEMAIM